MASKLKLVALAQREGESLEAGVRLALQAILSSPDFLFRVETDPKPKTGPAIAHPVNDFELASRLSYFLWASMPDQELFRVSQGTKTAATGCVGGASAPHAGRPEIAQPG